MAYKLTALGENRARRITRTHDPESAVILYLYREKDPLEVEDILNETHMDDRTAKSVLERLEVKGYLKEV